jgi:tetratricopeptide (TPR) repeat protein
MVDPDTPSVSPREPRIAIATVEGFLRQGEPLLAYNAIQDGLQEFPGNLRLRQLKGLALARSGDVERANALLHAIAAERSADSETLGMLARTHKDLGLTARSSADRDAHWSEAFRIYHDAYVAALRQRSARDAWYTGINAAAIALWREDLVTARRIATEVRDACIAAQADGALAQDYWLEASLGEAALILGNDAESAAHYRRAVQFAAGRFGDLASTRRQALLLAERLPRDTAWLIDILKIPPVLVYAGHFVGPVPPDHAGSAAGFEAAVAAAIRGRLTWVRPLAAYGTACSCTDILCLEALQEQGGETHLVLPFPGDELRRICIDGESSGWGPRFDRVLAAASSVTITSDHAARGSTATFDYANLVFTGMAELRARMLETPLHGLAIWEDRPGRRADATAALVELWRVRRIAVEEVRMARFATDVAPATDPNGTASNGAASNDAASIDAASNGAASNGAASIGAASLDAAVSPDAGTDASGPPSFKHEIRAMLFGDAVGYSGLSEDQTPHFITQFLGAVAALNESSAERPIHIETTGDGLYMVFTDVRQAGHYALQLRHLITTTDWVSRGLPGGLNIRIALHCGPVYHGRNPLTGAPLFTGPHTSRAARIEPVTPPGQVYASSAFAAVAAASGVRGLRFQYIGRMPLAKGYGLLGLYHVSPGETLK